MITKEECIDLYVNKNLTTYKIAELYKVHRKTVSRWLKKYKININGKQRKYESVKTIPLTSRQREIIIGTLLGDGCVAPHGRKNKNYRLIIGHCEKQKDLVLWKKSELNDFVNTINIRHDKRGNSTMWCFSTIVHDSFKFYENLFYVNRIKVIRPEIIELITPLSLAVWIMDDGSRYKSNISISTDSFTKGENEILKHMFETKFGIICKIVRYSRRNKDFYFLRFNKESSILLSNLVKDFVIDSMKYKLVNCSSTTTR